MMMKAKTDSLYLSMVYILTISPRLFFVGFQENDHSMLIRCKRVYCVDRFPNGKDNDDNRTADSKFILKKHLRHRKCNYYSRYDFYVRNP